MGKASMCIQMLQILNSGRIYKISELASLLETNPRNIIEYKYELEEAGYFIESIPGKYGGYKLGRTNIIPTINLTDEEKKALVDGSGYLLSRDDFYEKREYQLAVSKIYSSIDHTNIQPNPAIVNRFPLAMDDENLVARYKAIEECCTLKYKVKIKYLSLDNTKKERIIHPYKLFMYNNAWYVLAFDEKRNEVRYFKLNRIDTFEQLIGEKFRIPYSYDEKEYLDEFGMKQNGEWYDIKLKLKDQYAMLVKERIYGRNQIVEPIDDNTTILSCSMQNKDNIITFTLGFGDHCEIIEPIWLKKEIKKICEHISQSIVEVKK